MSAVGTLQGASSSTYLVQLFGSDSCSTFEYGEGQQPLSTVTVTTNASGQAGIEASAPIAPAGATGLSTGGCTLVTLPLLGGGNPANAVVYPACVSCQPSRQASRADQDAAADRGPRTRLSASRRDPSMSAYGLDPGESTGKPAALARSASSSS